MAEGATRDVAYPFIHMKAFVAIEATVIHARARAIKLTREGKPSAALPRGTAASNGEILGRGSAGCQRRNASFRVAI